MDMTIEQAQADLDRATAATEAAQRALDESSAALGAAINEGADLTEQIRVHDGGEGFDILVTKRATAEARIENFGARRDGRIQDLERATAAEDQARTRRNEAKFAIECTRFDDLRQGLGLRIRSFVEACRKDIEGPIREAEKAAAAAGREVDREPSRGLTTVESLEAQFKGEVDRLLAERDAVRFATAEAAHEKLRLRLAETRTSAGVARGLTARPEGAATGYAEHPEATTSDERPQGVTLDELERMRRVAASQMPSGEAN